MPTYTVYSATKSGLNGYTNSLNEEAKCLKMDEFKDLNGNMVVTNILPGAIKGTEVDIKAIGSKGQEFDYLHNVSMTRERCAEWMTIAISNQLSETVIAEPFEIFMWYLTKYFGPFTLPIIQFIAKSIELSSLALLEIIGSFSKNS